MKKRRAIRLLADLATPCALLLSAACSSSSSSGPASPGTASSSDGGGGGAFPDAPPDVDAGGAAPDASSSVALSVATATILVAPGETTGLEVSVARVGARADVLISVDGLPSGVTAGPLTVAAAANTGKLALAAAKDAAVGPVTLTIRGTSSGGSANAVASIDVRGLPGTPDLGFGTDGATTVVPFGRTTIADGDATFVAGSDATSKAVVVERLDAAGHADAAFGTAGMVTILDAHDPAMALASDGQLLVAYSLDTGSNAASTVTVRKYASSGTLDATFGNAGVATVGFAVDVSTFHYAAGITVQPDGKILIGGFIVRGTDYGHWMELARLSPAGSADVTFGTNGIVAADPARPGNAENMLVRPDGKIVIAGFDALYRRDASGAADVSFGTQGGASPAFSFQPGAALLSNGMLLIAGSTSARDPNRGLARYTTDGALDPTFGSGGVIRWASVDSAGATPTGLLVEDDGTLLVGTVPDSTTTSSHLVRLKADGTIDPSFGVQGFAAVPAGANAKYSYVGPLFRASHRRVVATATTTQNIVSRFWL